MCSECCAAARTPSHQVSATGFVGHHHRRCRLTLAPACPCGTETAPRRADAATRARPRSARRAHCARSALIVGHTRSGGVVGVDDDLGGLTEKFQVRVEPAQLPPRHDHLRSWLPQRVPVVDEQAGSKPASRPIARCAGSTHGESFRYMERGLSVKQIASGRGSGVPYIRDVWNRAGPWSQ